ncbi:MAG TPA: TolC family protein [Holophagaceae bacterium]|nr:TolC family protein [Holophagaceae bacterium]
MSVRVSIFVWAVAALPVAAQSPEAQVAKQVNALAQQPEPWSPGAAQDQVRDKVNALLRQGLTLDRARAVALLNNPDLQARMDGLGVAQADLVQAGLLTNPVLGVGIGFSRNGRGSSTEFSLVQELVTLFTRGRRKQVASLQLEADQAEVASSALDLLASVESVYRTVQADQGMRDLDATLLESAEASTELARRQYEAGNISELTYQTQASFSEQARLDLARAETKLIESHESLNRLLGLWGADTGWKVQDGLPELPHEEIAVDKLESLAVGQRLDLRAAQSQAKALMDAATLARHTRFTPNVDLGIRADKDAEGGRTLGPTLGVELPLFDHGQGRVARLEALARQAQDRVTARAVDIRSEVRQARERLRAARAMAEQYRDAILPRRERVMKLAQDSYNGMLLGVYDLILAKQAQTAAYRDYLDAMRGYWTARAELVRALGGALPSDTQTQEVKP